MEPHIRQFYVGILGFIAAFAMALLILVTTMWPTADVPASGVAVQAQTTSTATLATPAR